MDADPPTTPGRAKPTSNRKTGMQIAASLAALLVLALVAWRGELTENIVLGAFAVMGISGGGAQVGNVAEHIAKALPQVVEAWARGRRP